MGGVHIQHCEKDYLIPLLKPIPQGQVAHRRCTTIPGARELNRSLLSIIPFDEKNIRQTTLGTLATELVRHHRIACTMNLQRKTSNGIYQELKNTGV